MAVKNRLREIRHGLYIDTQVEFAELLGVTRPQVNKWEKQKEQPSMETSFKIWKRLRTRLPDINLQDLFTEDLD